MISHISIPRGCRRRVEAIPTTSEISKGSRGVSRERASAFVFGSTISEGSLGVSREEVSAFVFGSTNLGDEGWGEMRTPRAKPQFQHLVISSDRVVPQYLQYFAIEMLLRPESGSGLVKALTRGHDEPSM